MSSASEGGCFTITWEIENFSLLLSSLEDYCVFNSPIWKAESTEENARWHLKAFKVGFKLFFAGMTAKPGRCEMSFLTNTEAVPLKTYDDNDDYTVFLYENFAIASAMSRQSILPNDTLTVCCKVWKKTLKAGEFRIHSVIRKSNYIWDIEDIRPSMFYSNTFIENENLEFYMILDEKKSKENIYTVIFAGVPNRETSICLVKCELSFKNDSSRFIESSINRLGTTWRGVFEISENNMKKFLQLQFKFVFSVHTISENAIDPTSTLNSDLKHMYKDGLYRDVTLHSEGKSFSAHRNILAARSPVFRAMFEKDELTESRSGVVDIEDLKAGLTVDNAYDMLVLAYTTSDQELMKCVVDFIRDHLEVVSSTRWEELEEINSRLTSKITRELLLSGLLSGKKPSI